MDGDVLRAFAAHTPHEFAEAGLGILQQPMARPGGALRP
jgi:hypothetical protein